MKQKENIHSGHKKRMRERFLACEDFNGFSDHEMLELLLNYANIRCNTNETAHRLMDKFGSLDAVFDAHRDELMAVEGVGETIATLIVLQRELLRIYGQRKYDLKDKNICEEDLYPYICSLFAGKKEEQFYMLCISNTGKLKKTESINKGTFDGVSVDHRKIIKSAVNCDAFGIIFAHNHTTGVSTPSNTDLESTKFLQRSLDAVGIKLIDHFVVAGGECVSIMKDSMFKYLK